jgi:ferrous iron transport protein B
VKDNLKIDTSSAKKILLVGNPNTGKTTLFNNLTKSDEHIGNWHGVTVENKEKLAHFSGEVYDVVDTPGIYSLCPLSFEEEVATDTIFSHRDYKIINICDQNNLQRNLYLTLCLVEQGLDVVLAINQIDRKNIFKVDAKKLSELLGVNAIVINAEQKGDVEKLKTFVQNSARCHKTLPYLNQLQWTKTVKIPQGTDEKLLLIKAYEKDENFFKKHNLDSKVYFDAVPKDSLEALCALRYAHIDKIIDAATKRTDAVYGKSRFDKIALNKILSFPLFFLILAGVFYLTFFSLGAFLSDCLSKVLTLISSPILSLISKIFASSWLYDLFATAIFGGIGTVLSFLPQVVLLFFFLSVLEDSGYMSRIAFIFEDILGKIGLSGKSVYTLLMGFGCSTSAIMTARNMDDKNAKIKTAILCPYMSCSAKIPIYTVIGGAFFGAKNLFVIFFLYFLGVVTAIGISKIFDAFVLKSEKQSFVLEMPPYRRTSLKRVGKLLWKNTKEFLTRVGSVMVAMNVIIWVLSSFSFSFAYVLSTGGVSMLESIGRVLAPVFSPLGFGNWAVVASLLAGFVAKEVVVSSIAMFNGIDASATRLISSSILLPTSVVFFSSKASVLSFLVFCLLYTPCVGSVAMLTAEIGKKWTAIAVCVQLVTAYVLSLLFYNAALLFENFGAFKVLSVLLTVLLVAFCVIFVLKKRKNCCGNCKKCHKHCGK